ncbi:MAG: hypothetical protein AAFO74_15345 [Pseudomonadota bacterium]
MTEPRLRQLVFASHEHADIERLRHVLALGPGFVDPGVQEFGLTNGVFALGDQFLEIVVPTEANTAAGRFLDRSQGIGGYMAIFQTDNLDAVRGRTDAARIRRVWNIDLKDISASHLHPGDIGAAIVSIDEARPAASWRWGGPDWAKNSAPGELLGADIIARDPQALSQKWAGVLGTDAAALRGDVWQIDLAGGRLRILPGDRDAVTHFHLAHPDPSGCLARAAAQKLPYGPDLFELAGVTVTLTAIDPAA